jgi:hypothetical protein
LLSLLTTEKKSHNIELLEVGNVSGIVSGTLFHQNHHLGFIMLPHVKIPSRQGRKNVVRRQKNEKDSCTCSGMLHGIRSLRSICFCRQ